MEKDNGSSFESINRIEKARQLASQYHVPVIDVLNTMETVEQQRAMTRSLLSRKAVPRF